MTDPRRTTKGNFRYPLLEILFLTLSASACGLTEYEEIKVFGENQIDWLRKFLPYRNGIPHQDTLARVFNSMDPKTFSTLFSEWAKNIVQDPDNKVVAIDGKAVRSINKLEGTEENVTIVSAFCKEHNLCIGQESTDKKSNEITAIPKLLDMIFLRGSIVTLDAMGCQTEIAKKIKEEKEADYVLAVKGNQGGLKEVIEGLFGLPESRKNAKDNELTGKHLVERRCELINDLSALPGLEKWSGISSLAKLVSMRTDRKTGEVKEDIRYYISSMKDPEPERFMEIVRSHWSVENKLHWCLDVVYGEDSTAKRKANGVKNINMIKKVALWFHSRFDSLNTGKGKQLSKKNKMLMSLIDASFREDAMGLEI